MPLAFLLVLLAALAALAGAPSEALATPDRSPAAVASKDIVTVGAYMERSYKYDLDYNMSLTYSTEHVVLFRSGDALRDLSGLADPGGLAAHKQRNPKRWTKWRRAGGKLEIQLGKTWRALDATYDPLPRGFKLSRSYGRGGGGRGATRDVSVTGYRQLRFDASGRFTLDAGGGATTGSSSIHQREATRGGTYEISGYLLTLHFDDGTILQRTIITNPNGQKVIWLDGVAYTS